MDIKWGTTGRGFRVGAFKDRSGVECSIQKSSLATEEAIWLGCSEANPRVLVTGMGWVTAEVPEGLLCDTRMHLTREQVAELLPILQRFVDTGELP